MGERDEGRRETKKNTDKEGGAAAGGNEESISQSTWGNRIRIGAHYKSSPRFHTHTHTHTHKRKQFMNTDREIPSADSAELFGATHAHTLTSHTHTHTHTHTKQL